MKQALALLSLVLIPFSSLYAQSYDTDTDKQGLKGKVHWVKRTWYKPLPGSKEPDKSKIPDLYMRPNQLIEYNEKGKMRASMDYQRGSDDASGPTHRYYYDGDRLKKEVLENDAYEEMNSSTYTYDPAGRQISKEIRRGPADKLGITRNGKSETIWEGDRKIRLIDRDEKGQITYQTSYTCDAQGRVIKEVTTPVGLYSAHTYTYDAKGNLTKESYLDKDGQPSTIWIFENNAAGKPTKRTMQHFYQGKQDSEEVTIYGYNPQGDRTMQKTTRDGKVGYDYAWEHRYDAKGNIIQTVHIKAGTPEAVEVIELRYY